MTLRRPGVPTLRRIVFAAVVGGLTAGILITFIQAFKVLPLIEAAEYFEAGGSHADGGYGSRIMLTLLANCLTGIGSALLLTAAMAWRKADGVRDGLVWGAAGYIIFNLAPALGMAPELPGMAAADLVDRQLWWIATVIASAAGLGLIAFHPGTMPFLLGIAILALPHVAGAPVPPPGSNGTVPAELAAAFVAVSLGINLIFWVLIGCVSGAALKRLSMA